MIETLKRQAHDQTTGPDGGMAPLAALAAERAAFRSHLPELAREHDGEFVLIKGGEIIGTFDHHETALREGYRKFGIVPFLVRQVAAFEPAVYLPNVEP